MSATKVNRFFKEKIYLNLFNFAFPKSWKRATIATLTIALCLAAIAAVLHGISYIIAMIADACSSEAQYQKL